MTTALKIAVRLLRSGLLFLLQVQEAKESVLVTFDLLDKAPFRGNVVNVPTEPSLSDAYNVLVNAVNTGTMKILVPSPGFKNVSDNNAFIYIYIYLFIFYFFCREEGWKHDDDELMLNVLRCHETY